MDKEYLVSELVDIEETIDRINSSIVDAVREIRSQQDELNTLARYVRKFKIAIQNTEEEI